MYVYIMGKQRGMFFEQKQQQTVVALIYINHMKSSRILT
jgi:hypothetical protein